MSNLKIVVTEVTLAEVANWPAPTGDLITVLRAVDQPSKPLFINANSAWTQFGGFPLLAPDGTAVAPSYAFSSQPGTGMFRSSINGFAFTQAGVGVFGVNGASQLIMASNVLFGWDGGALYNNGLDTILARDSADTLAQRRGVNAQTFRLYNTFTDASNYERLEFGVAVGGNGANTFTISAGNAGTGIKRDIFLQGQRLLFQTAGANNRWIIDQNGVLSTPAGDNALDIGFFGASRPRNLYIGSTIFTTAPTAQAAGTYTVLTTDNTVINSVASTLTLPAVATSMGRKLRVVTTGANAIISNASNVVPITGGAAGTAILAATAGKWADLECNGTNWIITAAN